MKNNKVQKKKERKTRKKKGRKDLELLKNLRCDLYGGLIYKSVSGEKEVSPSCSWKEELKTGKKNRPNRGTKELGSDRQATASLTNDSLLRSQFQAQKDEIVIIDSEKLKTVDPFHSFV